MQSLHPDKALDEFVNVVSIWTNVAHMRDVLTVTSVPINTTTHHQIDTKDDESEVFDEDNPVGVVEGSHNKRV